jgi:hypothetical protein
MSRTSAFTALLAAALLAPAAAAAKDKPEEATDTVRYRGFGGVSYGVVKFIDKPNVEAGQTALSLANAEGTNRSLGADFLLRVGDSRWFAGYAVAFQGGSTFIRELSVFNTARTSPNPAACYGEQCYGMTTTSYFDVLHVPMEANTAWALDKGRFNFFIGGGPSIHIAQFTAFTAVSAVQRFSLESTDPENTTATSVVSKIEGKSRKYGIGGQVFLGGGVELGELPQIGGRWGLTVALRYQKVRDMTQLIEGEYSAQEYLLDGTECPDDTCPNTSRKWEEEVVVDGDNFGGRVGLVFFF